MFHSNHAYENQFEGWPHSLRGRAFLHWAVNVVRTCVLQRNSLQDEPAPSSIRAHFWLVHIDLREA